VKRILLAGFGQFEWFAPAWAKGLERLGFEVRFFDFGDWFSPGLMGRIETRFLRGPGIHRLSTGLKRSVASFKPEVVLIHNGNPVEPETVADLASGYWVAGYQHDDPFGLFGRKAYFRLFRRAIPYYQSHHVIRQENLSEYRQLGVQRVRILMTYYVPWLHSPPRDAGPRGSEPDRDVVFIGHAEADSRIQYLAALAEAGIRLEVFGAPKYWRRHLPPAVFNRLPPIQPVVGAEYARTIWGARISLAFYSRGNRDRYAYRVFEIPACGGFLLAQRTDVVQTLYAEGKEAEYFASAEELTDKVRFYLQHDEARERIAKAGHRRCLTSGYDVVSRMRQWVADIREFREQ